jgi:multiple sugar transport system substrate-binding protein
MASLTRRGFLKRVGASATFGVAATVLGGCGATPTAAPVSTQVSVAEPTATSAPAAAATEPVALRWVDEGGWDEPAKEQKYNDEICATFMEQNPDVTVTYEPGLGDWFEKLTAQMASGEAPDVFCGFGTYFKIWAEKGQVLDLNPAIDKNNLRDDLNDFFPNPLKGCQYKGQLIAMPKYLNVVVIYYNQDMFDAKGVAYPTKDWKWDDLRMVAKKLTDAATPVFGITSGFGLTRLDITSIWSHCGDVVDPNDDTKVLLDDPKTIEGLQYIHDLIWEDKSFGLTEMMAGLGGLDAFKAKMTAMLTEGSGIVTMVRDGVDFNWDLISTPNGECGTSPRTSMDGYHVYGKAQHPDEAFRFLSYLVSPTVCKKHLDYGMTPPRRSMTADWEAIMPDKNLKAVSEVMEVCRADVRAMVRDAQEFKEIWDPLYEQCMVLNKITVEELVTEASKQLRETYSKS